MSSRVTRAKKVAGARPSDVGFHRVLHHMTRHSHSCRHLLNPYPKRPVSEGFLLETPSLTAFFCIGIESSARPNTRRSQRDNTPPEPIVIRDSDDDMFDVAAIPALAASSSAVPVASGSRQVSGTASLTRRISELNVESHSDTSNQLKSRHRRFQIPRLTAAEATDIAGMNPFED